MIDWQSFSVFLAAALIIALTPGPGIFYVAARTIAGGRGEGLASSVGTGIGGLVHVVAGALGLSVLVLASAEAFAALKIAGAFYLLYLGIKAIREAGVVARPDAAATGARRAFRDGIVVESLNPKTAAFFLAFIPQFIDPTAPIAIQFVTLGLISVSLNTAVDIVVVFLVARARFAIAARANLIRRLRQGSGVVLCGLGASLLLARRSA